MALYTCEVGDNTEDQCWVNNAKKENWKEAEEAEENVRIPSNRRQQEDDSPEQISRSRDKKEKFNKWVQAR